MRTQTIRYWFTVLIAVSACFDSEPPPDRAGKRLQGLLNYAPNVNPFHEALGSRSFPDGVEKWAWRVVLASNFDPAAAAAYKETDPNHIQESPHFYAGAEIANDEWSAGLYVQPENYVVGGQSVTGVNWIVLDDPLLDPNTDSLFATSYRLVNLPLTLPVDMVAFSPAVFMQMSTLGIGRCCGAERLCDTQGGPPNPHCPNSFCADGTMMVSEFNLGAATLRGSTGRPFIPAHTFSADQLFSGACFPQVNPNCLSSTPVCTDPFLGSDPLVQWNTTIPVNSGSCAPVERPVGGRVVPKHCLYASEQIAGGAQGGPRAGRFGSAYFDCDGQCFECENFKRGADSNIRPRQCDLLRPLPGDPPGLPGSAGSGVCTSTAASVALEQVQLRVAAVVGVGQSGRGGCQTVQDSSRPDRYYKVCTDCSTTSCRKTIENAQSLVANGGSNTNTPTPCNAAQASCPPLSQGTGGGAAGGASGTGGGVVNPPATSTTPPPPSPNPVDTNTAKPKPAAGTAPAPATATTQKQETTGDPIAVSSGAFQLRQVDLSFPGAVRPLEFIRTYDSRSRDRSVLGSNWSHNWDVRVVPLNDENRPSWTDPYCAGSPDETTCVMLYVGDSPTLFYKEFLSGLFVPQAGVTSTLVPLHTPGGTPDSLTGWLLESADGHNLTFDADGYLSRDVDRFGNGFSVDQELTPSGRLFTTLCPRGISETAVDPANSTQFIVRAQQTTYYSADSLDCRALGSVVGVRSPFGRTPSGNPTLSFVVPAGSSQDYLDAKSLVESLQNTLGRQPGSPMPWGPRLKRVTRVKEITATSGSVITGTGRELVFEYYPVGSLPVAGTANALTMTGLLKQVTGPAGARIDFSYQSPELATGHPSFLNEVFLYQAKRFDGAAPTGLSPTPVRENLFTYAWTKNTLSSSAINLVRTKFTDFWVAQTNCTFTPVDNCGANRPLAVNVMSMAGELDDLEASYRSEVVDNIIKVTNGTGIVESETRYDVDPFSWSFDRAVKQRWGSSYAQPMPNAAPDWDTTLPEASFEFTEASPTNNGVDDATNNVLPSQILAAYGLEAPSSSTNAARGGMLLAPNSPDNTVIPNQLVPVAEGSASPAKTTPPACKLQKLPVLRTRLPGYRPSHDYFDLTPQASDSDSSTQGIDVTAFQLKRSRLSCEVLARAQTSDARTTDLLWTWVNDTGGNLVATRSLGRRQYMTLNANRICAWVKETNRDGFIRWMGINFQGRPLVDAMQGADGNYRFAETLYNADGNVISQRRPRAWNVTWSNGQGDTRYRYMDPVQSGANPPQPSPWYWARRSNVARVVERPKGLTVTEFQETSGGSTPVDSTGRYTDYTYEKVFNQVQRVARGWINSSQVDQLIETTEIIFDYQEGPATNLQPIVERQQALGYRWPNNSSLSILYPQLMAEIGLPFGAGDVNGDGVATRFGLPSLVRRTAANGQVEVTAYRWNRGGRLTWLQSSDGATQSAPNVAPSGGPVLEFEYLPLGLFSGTSSADNTGFLGSVHHQPRKSWPSTQGPTRAPCPHLAGPYQWLLPSTCTSANLVNELVTQRYLPNAIATALVGQHSSVRDATTTYEYHVTGGVKRVAGPDPRAVEIDRDVDGRVLTERLIDNGFEHSRVLYEYDVLMHPKKITRMAAAVHLGATEQKHDEEGRLVYECDEFTQGGCASPTIGSLPTSGASATNWYTRDGLLTRTMDAEGLWTDVARDPRGWVTTTTTYNPNIPADGLRTIDFTYDNDGNVTAKGFQGWVLTETRSYDGYGRVVAAKDRHNRYFKLNRSPRDAVVRYEVSSTPGGAALWYQWFELDGFARQLREYTNGTTSGFLTSEVQRRAGGQVWWTREYGKRPTFLTTNADGEVMFSEDESSALMALEVAPPASRDRSSATLRQSTFMTTATRVTLDVLGLPIAAREDGAGSGRTALNRTTTYIRNKLGDLLQQDDVDGKSTEFVVDFAGRVTAKREWVPTAPQPTQVSSTYTYDRRGSVTNVTDLNLKQTNSFYNAFGQLVRRETPSPTGHFTATWTYDGLGRPRYITPGGAQTYRHEYDANDRLAHLLKGTGDGQYLRQYTYDGLGRLSTAKNHNLGLVAPIGQAVVTNEWQYDALGRVALQRSTVGDTAPRPTRNTTSVFTNSTAAWQPVIRTTTRPDGSVVSELYDTLGRVTRLTRGTAGSPTTDFSYVGDLLTAQESISGSNKLRTVTTYDALGQPLSWGTIRNSASPPNLLNIQILRDASGRVGSHYRSEKRGTQAQEHTWRGYVYDSMRRVARVHEAPASGNGSAPSLGGAKTHSLTAAQVDAIATNYGAANRTWTYAREVKVGSVESITTTPGSPALQRLEVLGRTGGYQLVSYKRHDETARMVAYDSEVGRVNGDGLDTFAWNELSELRTVTPGSQSTSISEHYQYDGLGRLVVRREPGGAVLEEYAYDGNQMVVAFRNSPSSVVWNATWGPGLDNLVEVRPDGVRYLAVGDGKGSIGMYYNEASAFAASSLDYTPEGRVKWRMFKSDGSLETVPNPSCDQLGPSATWSTDCDVGPNNLPFGFHSAFKSPGSGLVYFRNRWLSTRTGEWLSPDPLGAVDSSNLYAFNAFDSVNNWDPFGLESGGHVLEATVIGRRKDLTGAQQNTSERRDPAHVAGAAQKLDPEPSTTQPSPKRTPLRIVPEQVPAKGPPVRLPPLRPAIVFRSTLVIGLLWPDPAGEGSTVCPGPVCEYRGREEQEQQCLPGLVCASTPPPTPPSPTPAPAPSPAPSPQPQAPPPPASPPVAPSPQPGPAPVSPPATTPAAPSGTPAAPQTPSPPPFPGMDPAKSPGPEFEWRGAQPPGSDNGAWFNPKTGETFHPDLKHGPPGPHWDWIPKRGRDQFRIFPDGKIEPKKPGDSR